MAKGDDIQARLVHLSVSVMALSEELPQTATGKHFAGQLLRCGTSAGPNYAEARGAESAMDFTHKLGIVLKELNETGVWLQMIGSCRIIPPRRIDPLSRECDELCKIIAVSRRTAREGRKTQRMKN